MNALVVDIEALARTWAAFDRVAHLRPIRDEAEYDRTVALMNCLLDAVGDREDHVLSSLLELVTQLVEDYDAIHYRMEGVDPREMLRHLMEARGLKQADLSEVLPQSNLSAILAGRRKISASLAGRLAKFFDVSPAIFIPS
jgi:HTH-type transcriptional regulator/antitoxin HigA